MKSGGSKGIIKSQLAGLLIGTGLVAGINLVGLFFHPEISFYNLAILVYFFTGLISGLLQPKLSWQWGIWITLPWMAWIFFNAVSIGFKEGIGTILVILFYFFPIMPACIGALLGAGITRWIAARKDKAFIL